MPLLTLRNVSLAFRGPPVLDGADLVVEPGERLGLLGRNGSGKTSLLRLIQGEVEPDRGEIARQQGLQTAMLPQEVPQGLRGRVFDEVARGLGPRAGAWPSIMRWPAAWLRRVAARATSCTPGSTAFNTPWSSTAVGPCIRRSRPSFRAWACRRTPTWPRFRPA